MFKNSFLPLLSLSNSIYAGIRIQGFANILNPEDMLCCKKCHRPFLFSRMYSKKMFCMNANQSPIAAADMPKKRGIVLLYPLGFIGTLYRLTNMQYYYYG